MVTVDDISVYLQHRRAALNATARGRTRPLPKLLRVALELLRIVEQGRYGITTEEKDALAMRVGSRIARLQAEVARLDGVLAAIDGGDRPCTDELVLRQWAYEGRTLGRSADELSRPELVRRRETA